MDMISTAHSSIKILARVVYELMLVGATIIATFAIGAYIGTYLGPVIIDPTLSPDGIEQLGWPLPFTASYWDDSNPAKAYQMNSFSPQNYLVDLLLFYGIIRLLLFGLKRILRPAIQRYDPHRYVDRYTPYVVLAIAGLLILYYLTLILFTEKPMPIRVGAPIQGAPIQVGR
jgi:hypothetical protein